MSLSNQIQDLTDQKEFLQELVKYKNRRLRELQLREAKFGLDTPVAILTEIADLKAEIDKFQVELKKIAVQIEQNSTLPETDHHPKPQISGHKNAKETLHENFILVDSFPQDGQRISRKQVEDFYLKFNNPIDIETEPYIVNYNVQRPGFAQWNVAGWIEYAENNTKLIWHPHPEALSNDSWFSPSEVDYQRIEIHLGRRGVDEWVLKDNYGNALPFTVIRVFIPADNVKAGDEK